MSGFGWLAALAALGLNACASVPSIEHAHAPARAPATVIYVARRGWHIDIVLPVDRLSLPLQSTLGEFPAARYLVFGLGDRRYIEAAHHQLPALLAALWPGPAVMLITGLKAPPQEAFGAQHVVELRATPEQIDALDSFIWASLTHAAAARDQLPAPALGPYGGSLYFSSEQRYSAVHTCNTWAAEALQAAQWQIHSKRVVFAGQLWSQLLAVDRRSRRRLAAGRLGAVLAHDGRPAIARHHHGGVSLRRSR